MYLVLSHAVTFGVMFLASLFDLDYGEIPDFILLSGVISAVSLHAAESLSRAGGGFLSLVASPASASVGAALSDPLVLSLLAGLLCFGYGWSAYLAGVWGGADALALALLGFGAVSPIDGSLQLQVIGLGTSLLAAVVVYTLTFALWNAATTPGIARDLLRSLRDRRWRWIGSSAIAAALIPLVGGWRGRLVGLLVFVWVPLYTLLNSVQRKAMSKEVEVGDLEGGEVVDAPGTDSRIRGITEDEIAELESDTVEVKSGIRLLPAFPVAIAIADLSSIGLYAAGVIA